VFREKRFLNRKYLDQTQEFYAVGEPSSWRFSPAMFAPFVPVWAP
jgi:hypothetical protein